MLNVGPRPRVIGTAFRKQEWADTEKLSWAKIDIFHDRTVVVCLSSSLGFKEPYIHLIS